MKRFGLIFAALFFSLFINFIDAGATEEGEKSLITKSYEKYITELCDVKYTETDVIIDPSAFIDTDMEIVSKRDFEKKKGNAIITSDEGHVTWEFDVLEEGMYNIRVEYYPVQGKGGSIERVLYINDEVPFNEARYIELKRVWSDDGEVKQDSRGNDIKPSQIETPQWQTEWLNDSSKFYNEPFKFYLKKGKNTITIESVREPLMIGGITLGKYQDIPSYEDVLKSYNEKKLVKVKAEPIKIQAEKAFQKSSQSIYPQYDLSSPKTEPYAIGKIKFNTIGKEKWKMPGEWIVWKFKVEEDGLYNIIPRFRQNMYAGLFVSRKLMIDGRIPFKEAENIRFIYNNDWQIECLGNEKTDYLFYLEKGEHEVKMEVVLGDMADILRTAQDSLYTLNGIYKNIHMITGSTPDVYRNYDFIKIMPDTIQEMKVQSELLYSLSDKLKKITGEKGEHSILLDKVAYILSSIHQKPEIIPDKLNSLKNNIGALGTWLLSTREQPLELDYILIQGDNSDIPKATPNLIESIVFFIKSFFSSFTQDYSSVGVVYDGKELQNDDVVTVWTASGRDQAQIIKQMVDDMFTPQTGIQVNLKLVAPGTLLPSVLSGTGPDISLSNSIGEPINYSIRKAVADLSQFDNYNDVAKRFHKSALIPYTFDGKVFALPETQSFPMMFCRKDIFKELGLEVPQTWDEFYSLIPKLLKKNMEIGFPNPNLVKDMSVNESINKGNKALDGMLIFLYQMGGEIYKQRGAKSNFDSEIAVKAFRQHCDLFTAYKFPVEYDFANRFRSGRMPIGIADYTLYNQLTVFAPEIRGLWEFVPLPGTVQPDGSINKSSPGTGTATMMLNSAKNKDNAWAFMDWWSTARVQSRFGVEMESLIGPAAKQPTANMEAISMMPWTNRDYKALMAQWDEVVGTPEVPGGYYTGRNYIFAFNKVYNTGSNSEETIMDYIKEINNELKRKRLEFGLE